MHPLLRDLWVAGLLEKDSYLRIRKAEVTVDAAADLGQRFLNSTQRCGPESDSLVKVGDIDDKVGQAASMHNKDPFVSIRSWTTFWASSGVRARAPHPVMTAPS